VTCELDPADTEDWVTPNVEIDCAESTGATRTDLDDRGLPTRIYQPSPTGSGEVSQLRTYTLRGQLETETDFATNPTAVGTPPALSPTTMPASSLRPRTPWGLRSSISTTTTAIANSAARPRP
jgi:hypothetical protein